MRGGESAQHAVPYEPLALTHIDVDLSGLDDFRAFISQELDANLRPAVEVISREHSAGVGFGWHNPGTQVQAARQRYNEMLTTSTANLAAYIDAAEIMIDAIRRVGANYRDSDALAAAGSNAINTELTGAIVAAEQARLDAAVAAQEQGGRQHFDRTGSAVVL